METKHDQRIFGPYLINGQPRWADPIEVQHHLSALLEGDPNQALADYHAADAGVAYRTRVRVLAAVCQAFGLPPFDPATGQGATWTECRAVLDAFLAFCQDLKKKPAPSPMWPRPTASAPSRSTTPASLDCGCS